MKKLLSSVCVVAAALASAPSALAAPTTINLQTNEGGVSSIELNKAVSINRDCPGYAVLRHEGTILKQIPASNIQAVYCFTGFDRVQLGSLHITFFTNTQTSPATAVGNYTVDIPAGYFSYGGTEPNEAMTLEYTVVDSTAGGPTYDPPTSSHVLEIDKFTVTFPKGATDIAYTPSGEPGTETSTYLDFYNLSDSQTRYTLNFDVEGEVATISIDPKPVTIGTYYLDVPAGAFTYKLDDKEVTNPATTINVSIIAPSEGLTTTPAPGEYESFTSYPASAEENPYYIFFELTVPEQLSFVLAATPQLAPVKDGVADFNSNNQKFKVIKTGDNTIGLASFDYTLWRKESTLTPLPGEYVLYIPEKCYQTVKGINSPAEFRFTIKESESPQIYTVLPALDEQQKSLSNIVLTFPDAKKITWTPGQYVAITMDTYEYCLAPVVTKDNELTITIPAPIEVEGEWEVNIPASGLKVDGHPKPIRILYTVKEGEEGGSTAVETIDTDVNVNVYTVSGIQVLRNAEAASLKALPAGLYIVNGKKVVIR